MPCIVYKSNAIGIKLFDRGVTALLTSGLHVPMPSSGWLSHRNPR